MSESWNACHVLVTNLKWNYRQEWSIIPKAKSHDMVKKNKKNKSGLTEKYVTEKETKVGTPEVNFLITKYK